MTRAAEGARNLFDNCVHASPGETVLVVREDESFGYFEAAAAEIVEEEARARGATVFSLTTPRVRGPNDVPEIVRHAIEHADHTIFFNRIGDQMRFRTLPGAGSKTITYALDVETLGDEFCTMPHDMMVEFLELLQAKIDASKEWHVTCPLGTDATGTLPPVAPDAPKGDFTLNLFPVTVFRPIPCETMNGRVMLRRWVNGTNTHVYDPEVLRLDGTVTAVVEDGRITCFEGDASLVASIEEHYRRVADELSLDPMLVHSWHSGMHPRVRYTRAPDADPVRWAGITFASPRYLHFHTCGHYAPGEISWHVIDPTVEFDGETFYKDGDMTFTQRPEVQALLARHGFTADALATCRDIGL